MEILFIGKPALDIYLPLQEMPNEGDIFTIRNQIESVGNVGCTAACLLGKWKMPVHITGTIGNDGYGEKIRNTLLQYKNIDVKHIEVDYTHPTSLNYYVLNTKTGVSSKVICYDPNVQLQKYKYDFLPTWAVIDGTDQAGALALLNNTNNTNVKTIFYARLGDKDTIAMSKRCTHVICTQLFAEMLTHTACDGTAEGCVNLYQKIADLTDKNNYIIILNNHKILYSESGQVKMLPAMKFNSADYSSFDSTFVGAFTFAMVLENNINDAVKFANVAASLSLTKVGEETALPELDEVLDNSGLRSRLIINPNATAPQPQQQSQIQAQPVPGTDNIIGVSTNPQPGNPVDNFVPNNIPVQNPEPQVNAFTQQVQPVQPAQQVEPMQNGQVIAPQQQVVQPIQPQAQQPTVTQTITPVVQQVQPVETNMFDNPNV